MKFSRKLAYLILGGTLTLLAAHSPLHADQLKSPHFGPGAIIARNGTLMNIGQAGVGRSRSTTHQMKTGVISVLVALSNARLRGDIDGDGDVDWHDHAIFVRCMNGPDRNRPPLLCSQEHFDLADLEGDVDVDLHDFIGLSSAIAAG